MNQESSTDQGNVELLFQGDLEQAAAEVDAAFFKIQFSRPVEVHQFRLVRGGNIPHAGLKESITQKGEEIENLEIFAKNRERGRGFTLISTSDRISEKGNHDTIIPIDPNYTVYSSITSDLHRPGDS